MQKMQIVICGADNMQVATIKSAIRERIMVGGGISLGSIYTVQTQTSSKTEILIILIPGQKATEDDLGLLEDLRERIRIAGGLPLNYYRVVCARESRE